MKTGREFKIKWTELVLNCRNRAEMKGKKTCLLCGKEGDVLGKIGCWTFFGCCWKRSVFLIFFF